MSENTAEEKTEEKLKEKLYFDLKNEINDKLKRIESMSTFCITTMITVFTFVLKEENISCWVFLLPLILIIMVSYRAANNRIDIRKISSYIEAKELEPPGLTWEKDNADLTESMKSEKKSENFGWFYKISSSWCKFPDFFLMTIICIIIFFVNFNYKENWELSLAILVTTFAFVTELWLFAKLNLMEKKLNREKFIKKFNHNIGGQS